MTATVKTISRQNGIAGQVAFDVRLDYSGTESKACFSGNTNGGPIVLISGGVQIFVEDPARFGPKLSTEWIRNFYSR